MKIRDRKQKSVDFEATKIDRHIARLDIAHRNSHRVDEFCLMMTLQIGHPGNERCERTEKPQRAPRQ